VYDISADGRIVDIRGRKLCIFKNFQMSCVQGTIERKVTAIEYRKGGYLPAFCKDSHRNERQQIFYGYRNGQ
jgi:phosphatidylserine decarboxylase